MSGRTLPGSFGSRNGQPGSRRLATAEARARSHVSGPCGVAGAVAPLAPETLRRAIEAQECPWCGRSGFMRLALHVHKAHGVSARELRLMADLSTRTPLCSPETSARSREALLSRDDYEDFLARALASPHNSPHQRSIRNADAANTIAAALRRRFVSRYDEAERAFLAGAATVEEIATQVEMSPKAVARELRRRGLDVTSRTAAWRREHLNDIRNSAWSAAAEGKRLRQRRRVDRFESLGGTRAAAAVMAKEEGVFLKSMVSSLRKAGAAVPDGRASAIEVTR